MAERGIYCELRLWYLSVPRYRFRGLCQLRDKFRILIPISQEEPRMWVDPAKRVQAAGFCANNIYTQRGERGVHLNRGFAESSVNKPKRKYLFNWSIICA